MSTVLELADDTYQQCTVLAEQEHRTPDTMLCLCLLAYNTIRITSCISRWR